jgi:hypothetical protein
MDHACGVRASQRLSDTRRDSEERSQVELAGELIEPVASGRSKPVQPETAARDHLGECIAHYQRLGEV